MRPPSMYTAKRHIIDAAGLHKYPVPELKTTKTFIGAMADTTSPPAIMQPKQTDFTPGCSFEFSGCLVKASLW